MRFAFALLLPALFLPGAAACQRPAPAEETAPVRSVEDAARAEAGIHAGDFLGRVQVMAHDSMRGRDTPSPGLEATAAWIAEEFRRMGLTPAGDGGTFLQRYPVRALALDLDGSSFRLGPAALAFGADALPVLFGAPTRSAGQGPLVVLSGGLEPERVAELDLAGRAVLFVPSEPLTGTQLVRLLQAARSRDAAVVLLASDASDAQWAAAAATLAAARFPPVGPVSAFSPFLQVRGEALTPVLLAAGVDLGELRRGGEGGGGVRRTDVPGLLVAAAQEARIVDDTAPNVVGLLEGSDPALRDEYVVFSAHMDHVGVGAPDARGDSIYNGADDNASGTAAVLEVAEAMAALEVRPRRSVLFALVSGEEKGLWGSAYFVDHPPVPLGSMVANINVDMVGRNWPDTIVVIGREHSDLGETLSRVNAARPGLGMTAIGDLWPQERFFYRSDHYNFARRGVPALFFFNGVHGDYHRPSDEAERLDPEKAARIARLLFHLGLEIADAERRPVWNPESRRAIVQGSPGRW